jgi:hypothetical protein
VEAVMEFSFADDGKRCRRCTAYHKSVRERFFCYHERNPDVYRFMVFYARYAKERGFQRYSIWAIAQRVRWHMSMANPIPDAHSVYKISNDYLAHYSRLIARQNPDLEGFFKFKPLKRVV